MIGKRAASAAMMTTANGVTLPAVVFALLKAKTVLTMAFLLTLAHAARTFLATHAKTLLDVHGATLLPSATTKEMLTDVTCIKLVTLHALNTAKMLALAALFATLSKVVFGAVTLNLALILMLLLARDNLLARSAKVTDIATLVWMKLDATGVKVLNPFALQRVALLEFPRLTIACHTATV
jgi:hypothetical protein